MSERKRVIVYVDGFNLYYGCLQGTRCPRLDLGTLCTRLLPRDDVVGIKYFTAKVGPRPWGSQKSQQESQAQEFYLRALRTVPNLTRPFRALPNPRNLGSACEAASGEITV